MNSDQIDTYACKKGAPLINDSMCLELTGIMRSISRGSHLRSVLAEVIESVKRVSRAADVRVKVYSSEVALELIDPRSDDESGECPIIISEGGPDPSQTHEDWKIIEGCYFTRSKQWRNSSSPDSGQSKWQEGDVFTFPVLYASGDCIADLEVFETTDGFLLTDCDVLRIRLLAELAAVAISKLKEEIRFERISDDMKQRTALLEDLLTISSSIVSERSPDTLSRMILTSLATLFGFQRVTLVGLDESVGEFRWLATFGYSAESAEAALSRTIPPEVVLEEFVAGNSISRSAYHIPFEKMSDRSRKYFITPETVNSAAELGPRKDRELREGDALAFVLRDSSARIVGAVYASMPLDGLIPDKQTIETIEIFTSLAEVAMEDARLSEDREVALRLSSQRTEQLSRIFELTSELMYVKNLDQLLDDVLKTLAQLLGLRRMVIGIRNDERGTFAVQAVYGYPEENVKGIKAVEYPIERVTHVIDPESTPYSASPVKWRKKVGRRTYYIPTESADREPDDVVYYPDKDLIRHPRKSKDHWHELDYMDTYIFDREGEVLAYIEILRPRDDRVPDSDTIEVIEIFASLVGIAIENSRLFQSQVESRRSAEFFTDLLSHDIKNFNQAIMGYLDMLRVHLPAPEQVSQLDKIAYQVMNVNRLANDVRTMSRLTWGNVNLARTDLGAVLVESADNVKTYYLTKDIEITARNVEPQRFFVNADELLREMFSNLLTNAVKYDSHDRVIIEIEVSRESEGKRRWVTASISDRGCGVADDMKEAIFERFSRGVKLKGSSGLGLHIVRMLAKRYRGTVWIEDRIQGRSDQGSVFKVKLPEY